MQQTSLNKHRPLPGIKSPTDEPLSSKPAQQDDADNDKRPTSDVVPDSEASVADSAPENKPKIATGPSTIAYKLKDLPLDEVTNEVVLRINRLKTLTKFSNYDCSDDLSYLSAATRCGSNPEVNYVGFLIPDMVNHLITNLLAKI